MEETKTTEHWTAARYIRSNGEILDFTDLYEVSDLGRVRSLNYHKTKKTKIMNIHNDGSFHHKNKDAWYSISLQKGAKQYKVSVHRLVLSSFDPEGFRPGRIVNHKTERTQTSCINELSNLEWATPSQNVTERCKELISKTQVNHPATSKKIRSIDQNTGKTIVYPSIHEAGRILDIKQATISWYLIHNKVYKKRGLRFEYIK